jgi:hypothetical protein
MPGVPGAGGPIPKRSNQRHGHRTQAEIGEIDKAPGAEQVDVPSADEKWHSIARQWYESLAGSGQSVFYEPSDWATAYLIAESISRDLKPQFVGISEQTGEPIIEAIPMKGASLAAYLKAMTALLVTEGDRRRARVELERPAVPGGEAPDVSWIDDARSRLRAAD